MKESFNTALRFFNLAWSIDPNDKDCEKAIDLIISKFKKQTNLPFTSNFFYIMLIK